MFVADVFDAVIIDNATGEVAGSTTLTSSSINVDVQENDIRAGKGNTLQGVLHSARDIKVETDDVVFRYDWMARKLGKAIVTGAGVGYAMPIWYTASGTSTITIAVAPAPKATGHGMKIYKKDGTEVTGFTVSSGTVTFPTGVLAGDSVEVRTYKFDTPATTQRIDIDTTSFASGCTLILDTIEIDENEKPVYRIQYMFPVAIPNGTFTVSTASERNASSNATSFRIAKPATSNIVGTVQKFPII